MTRVVSETHEFAHEGFAGSESRFDMTGWQLVPREDLEEAGPGGEEATTDEDRG